jgi:hypothetical protein
VAKLLRCRGIPFAVSTGYAATGLPAPFGDAPFIAKPFEPNAMAELVIQLIAPKSVEVHWRIRVADSWRHVSARASFTSRTRRAAHEKCPLSRLTDHNIRNARAGGSFPPAAPPFQGLSTQQENPSLRIVSAHQAAKDGASKKPDASETSRLVRT